MNIEQLNSYIDNKESLDQRALSQIMLLIEKYPYFQIAHMMLLKAMFLTQPEKYNGQLKISASFISDKKRLYQYIHTDKVTPVIQDEKTEEKSEIKAEKTPEQKIPEIKQETKEIEKIKAKEIITQPEKEVTLNQIKQEEKQIIDKEPDIEEKSIKSEEIITGHPTYEKKEETKKTIIKDRDIPETENLITEITEEKNIIEIKHIKEKEIAETVINKEPEIYEKKNETIKLEKPEEPVKKETSQLLNDVVTKKQDLKTKEPSKENSSVILSQTTEKKHQKIVTDFFHITDKEKEEKKQLEPEKEKIVSKIIVPDSKEKKETVNSPELEALLEEKRKRMLAKKDAEKTQEEETHIQKISKIKEVIESKKEVQKIISEEEQRPIKEFVVEKKTEPEKTEKKREIAAEIPQQKTITEEEKAETSTNDTMSSIFSKIRQIKKEMNIESSQNRETIDINPNVESKKIIRKRTDDTKGAGKVIKESFIGFEDSEIKTNELISENFTKIEKKEVIDLNKADSEEIKLSEITAKDLFKKHLQEKEQVDQSKEKTLPITSNPDDFDKNETFKTEIKKEQSFKPTDLIKEAEKVIPELKPEKEIKSPEKETAAEALLRRIAEKKQRMHEEREKEEYEKTIEKEEFTSFKAEIEIPETKSEEKIEIPEIKKEFENVEADNEIENQELIREKEVKQEIPKEKKSQDLIESFIEKSESLERIGTKETKIQGDISEKSTEEKEEFMTETMADLFIQQKNYSKAIEIYNKLILKYPEKKTYFAIQIKKTQSLIK